VCAELIVGHFDGGGEGCGNVKSELCKYLGVSGFPPHNGSQVSREQIRGGLVIDFVLFREIMAW
jgi:hypothetical protein